MKKILTVGLGILLLIFPFAGCKEQEQFDPNKPLLRDYDFVYLAHYAYGTSDGNISMGNVKKSWKTDGNESYMLAHNYKTFKKYVEEYTYLDVEDLCNKSLFDEHVVVFVYHAFGSGREFGEYLNFALDGDVLSFTMVRESDMTYGCTSFHDIVVMPKPDNWDDFSAKKTYTWNVRITDLSRR